MIVFDLQCLDGGERFEAWFASNDDFERQAKERLVSCPVCQSSRIAKAPMAPLVPKTSAQASDTIGHLATIQANLLKDSRWVGDRFAETARAMHHGEVEAGSVHGEATADEAKSLLSEGVPIVPLPLPVVPPNQVN